MGKKSKRSKPKVGQKGGGAAPAPAAAAADVTAAGVAGSGAPAPQPPTHQPPTPPPNAACWICLDGDPDEGGSPIVRNCSCRGDDAGFAHISCLVKYAGTKTAEIEEANASGQQSRNPSEPWEICPHCRREYQGHVALEMSKSLLSYIDDNYPPSDELIKLTPLTTIMKTVVMMHPENKPELREEGKRAGAQMLEVIGRSGHLKDEKYMNGQSMFAFAALARFYEAEETKEGYEKALEYWREAHDLSKSQEADGLQIHGIESGIDRVRCKLGGRKKSRPSEDQLKDLRYEYLKSMKRWGKESTDTIQSGIILATGLLRSGENSLECERLCVKLLAISRRVHGPDHDLTDRIESGLRHSRVRRLVTVVAANSIVHRVLEVNEEERKYTTEADEGVASEVAFDDGYLIMPGTPVVCHGLKNAQHLNGKLGDVRSFDTETNRHAVRFEDKTLNKALVKAVNLRIVIDLPAES